jgi:hypothetical protein
MVKGMEIMSPKENTRKVALLRKNKEEVPMENYLVKEDIKHLLNGVGRVVEFGTVHNDKKGDVNPTIDPRYNYVISVAEGEFELGQFSGFVRTLDNEGECMVGFWRLDFAGGDLKYPVSRPFGKFAHYYKDGSFKSPDGIYCGDEKKWN